MRSLCWRVWERVGACGQEWETTLRSFSSKSPLIEGRVSEDVERSSAQLTNLALLSSAPLQLVRKLADRTPHVLQIDAFASAENKFSMMPCQEPNNVPWYLASRRVPDRFCVMQINEHFATQSRKIRPPLQICHSTVAQHPHHVLHLQLGSGHFR